MFNIGPAELLIIGLVLLIAVGPEQLPGVIRRAGSTVAQFRSMTDGLRSEFMAGLDEIERATDIERWSDQDSDVGKGDPATRRGGVKDTSAGAGDVADTLFTDEDRPPDPDPNPRQDGSADPGEGMNGASETPDGAADETATSADEGETSR